MVATSGTNEASLPILTEFSNNDLFEQIFLFSLQEKDFAPPLEKMPDSTHSLLVVSTVRLSYSLELVLDDLKRLY